MSTQPPPAIPPRPSRSPQQQQQQQQGPPPTSIPDAPKIPPRPPRPTKRVERSMSPLRHSYAPSPLNERPRMTRTTSNNQPQRPPSVTIPSLGEEGIEYEDLDVKSVSESHNHNHNQSPAETRNVGSDLKLHAPRPSLPTFSANAKVAAVTRTDSRQATAAGLGAVGSPTSDEPERPSRSPHSRTSGSRADSSTASSDRYQSLHLGDEHGIPEIGRRVPMYPNAGDVQAPSASPCEQGSQRPGRSQHRTRSSREISLPPGSYGLHGHGVHPNDKFEKAWYEKHPDEYVKEEQGQYGPGVGTPRPDWALSSNDLNKIVRGSAVTGSGMGTSPAVTGTPEEEIGYIAADEYTHRIASPAPDLGAQPAVESPLRKMSRPTAETENKQETKPEDPGVIHVDDPHHSVYHPDGFAQTPAPEEQTRGLEEGEGDEDEPILAADEVRPEFAFQHPAVSPTFDRSDSFEHEARARTPSASDSRSNSGPTLAPYTSRGEEREDIHTPLEDVAEYEPLFPEDETEEKRSVSAADRVKQRPDTLKHRFPSQDIWEDSPNSAQLQATVSTADIPKNETFETPEQESFRRNQTASVDPHEVASHILESEDHQEGTNRPSLSQQRFPSRDTWEDAPDSQQLVTTIEAPVEASEGTDVPSKPSIPARPQRRPQQSPPVDASTKPLISPTEKRQPPSIPDRPKPQIPSRPAKRSPEEPKEAPAVKPKPPVPARPGGSKIAALKAGFLSDLNSRLQVGPQGPKPQEKEEEAPKEKKPLQDARKGRARGPARRKPAAPAPAATTATENADTKLPTIPEVKITETWNVWQVDEAGKLVVGDNDTITDKPAPSQPDVSPLAPELSQNVAGEPTDPQPQPSPVTEEAPKVEPSHPEPTTEPSPPEPGHLEPIHLESGYPETSIEPSHPEPTIEPSHTESNHPEPATEPSHPEPTIEPSHTESNHPEPATELAAKPAETKASPTEPATETLVDDKSSQVTLDIGLEEAAENMAAFADGKRQSDGDIRLP